MSGSGERLDGVVDKIKTIAELAGGLAIAAVTFYTAIIKIRK